jgi:type III secretory pathway component EscV
MDMIEIHVPELAERFATNSRDLSLLVVLLRNMVDEFVPIVSFREIVETFLRLTAKNTVRLEILRSLRCLPAIRSHLPGNDGVCSYYQLPASLEKEFELSIQTVGAAQFLAMEPEKTQAILRTVRSRFAAASNAALVVSNPVIRRFVRKLVELEFPYLFVLSREELLPGSDGRIIGEIDDLSRTSTA